MKHTCIPYGSELLNQWNHSIEGKPRITTDLEQAELSVSSPNGRTFTVVTKHLLSALASPALVIYDFVMSLFFGVAALFTCKEELYTHFAGHLKSIIHTPCDTWMHIRGMFHSTIWDDSVRSNSPSSEISTSPSPQDDILPRPNPIPKQRGLSLSDSADSFFNDDDNGIDDHREVGDSALPRPAHVIDSQSESPSSPAHVIEDQPASPPLNVATTAEERDPPLRSNRSSARLRRQGSSSFPPTKAPSRRRRDVTYAMVVVTRTPPTIFTNSRSARRVEPPAVVRPVGQLDARAALEHFIASTHSPVGDSATRIRHRRTETIGELLPIVPPLTNHILDLGRGIQLVDATIASGAEQVIPDADSMVNPTEARAQRAVAAAERAVNSARRALDPRREEAELATLRFMQGFTGSPQKRNV